MRMEMVARKEIGIHIRRREVKMQILVGCCWSCPKDGHPVETSLCSGAVLPKTWNKKEKNRESIILDDIHSKWWGKLDECYLQHGNASKVWRSCQLGGTVREHPFSLLKYIIQQDK